jgi:NADH dehydrogenase FAD-containing subunit
MPTERNGSRRRRVVIIGGGFGGLAAAQKLRHADVDVTLVDRTNHHKKKITRIEKMQKANPN